MKGYRVSPEIILDIADHCDRATLRRLMQTSRYMNALIADKERSIAAAALQKFLLPPLGEVLSSEDERRCHIPEKFSFATIQEMDLRERRMVSILDNSGFLLTDDRKKLGLTLDSFLRFKAGLKRSLYQTDRLADLETRPEVLHVQNQIIRRLSSLQVGGDRVGGAATQNDLDKIEALENAVMLQHHAEAKAQRAAIMVHRDLQFEMIRGLSTIDIAWLLTLCDGAMKGCMRYYAKMYESDPAGTHYKVVAFKEELLRKGSFVLWAFVRGGGSMDAFAKKSLRQTSEEIMGFEIGKHQNRGLSSCLHREMRRRLLEKMQREDPLFLDEDQRALGPFRVTAAVHRMISEEIDCKNWPGYSNIVYPPVE